MKTKVDLHKLALLGMTFFALTTHAQAQYTNLLSTTEPYLTTSRSVPTLNTSISKTQTAELSAVGFAKLEANILVEKQQIVASGQSSFHLSASNEQLEKGIVGVSALNFSFNDVAQELLTWSGRSTKLGNLGFVVKPGQVLEYDPKALVLTGRLEGFISADYMGQFAEPLGDSERDHNRSPRQAATVFVKMQLASPLSEAKGDTPLRQQVGMQVAIQADQDAKLSAYGIELTTQPVFEMEYIISFYFEVGKNLCVQPVRIGKLTWSWPTFSVVYTGSGLSFGKPEAIKQWAKADVTFKWRSWKTVFKSQFFTFSTSEANDLLDEVNDSDCVEVYFVNGDAGMHNNWGGGATFWSGESYTKIISSDANATFGIDKVHLAHELGHALDLPHPNSFNASSTNTLMCPSGFMNDNPARNSQENKNNLSNPLLTFTLKAKSAGPDCNNSSDCGACP